jgi:hypothetical protein
MTPLVVTRIWHKPAARKESGAQPALVTPLLWVQGSYYLLTGVWPLVSIKTFQMVTGPKTDHLATGRETDHWLVMTVGFLVTGVAITLLVSAWRKRHPPEVAVLAITTALGLTTIDILYVARRVIAPIYLVDAAAEMVLIAAWCVACLTVPRPQQAIRTRYLTAMP